ncbi:MAG TPA: hypothetical protein EYN66_05725, partial [Myxococcales bacterium]|nr:hypothetical protein [Myxococcales bacterium]
MNEGYRANLAYGVSMADSVAANTAFVTGMADFTMMAKDQRQALTKNVLLLGEMGVGMDTAAQAANFLSKGLGMTGPEIAATNRELVGLSEALKVPPDVIFKDFAAASKELAKYGDGMIEVFKGLEEQAKNTGLSVSDLLGIAKQFDQFDTAGEAVGRLNAILGGPYLNAIDMVNMSEAERVEALRNTMEMSGRVFNELSRHEQQAIATAAGISDMEQASKLFGGTSEEFEAHALSQAEMQEKAAENQAAMEKLTQAGMALGVALTPLIEILAGIADMFMAVLTVGGSIASLFTDDEGVIAGWNTATTVAIGLGVAIKMLTLETLALYAAAVLPVVAFVAMGLGVKKMLSMMSPAGRIVGGLIAILMGLYYAITMVKAAGSAGLSLTESTATAALVAGIMAGVWG